MKKKDLSQSRKRISIAIMAIAVFMFFSCSRKSGCKINDQNNVGPEYNKQGQLKRSKTKTGLFPK